MKGRGSDDSALEKFILCKPRTKDRSCLIYEVSRLLQQCYNRAWIFSLYRELYEVCAKGARNLDYSMFSPVFLRLVNPFFFFFSPDAIDYGPH